APGVWFREGDLINLGHCNNIVIEMKDYLIVVDANFPNGARAAMADARRVSSKPVKYVFDTHHHGDHSYGNAVWTDAGATTLAYKGVADEMKRYEPGRWQQTAKERKDVAEMHRPSVEPPKQTFDNDEFILDDGTRKVEFHFFGWAHTRGDGFVYLPHEQILCTGDAVVNGPYNFTGDGNIGNWPAVVRAAQKLKVKTVLPGHGVPGGPEVMAGQALFMVELRKAVMSAVDQGKQPADLARLQLPDSVKNWVGDGFAGQAKDTYEEITQGKPHGEIAGGK
ncbi:MAG TPA: MBL fold metallo-hydrolase, partial [Bryobacteraceae bacterium]|nr:MBL fold metallo-hydrolase [Bryobacteraceae bacterium]